MFRGSVNSISVAWSGVGGIRRSSRSTSWRRRSASVIPNWFDTKRTTEQPRAWELWFPREVISLGKTQLAVATDWIEAHKKHIAAK